MPYKLGPLTNQTQSRLLLLYYYYYHFTSPQQQHATSVLLFFRRSERRQRRLIGVRGLVAQSSFLQKYFVIPPILLNLVPCTQDGIFPDGGEGHVDREICNPADPSESGAAYAGLHLPGLWTQQVRLAQLERKMLHNTKPSGKEFRY